MMQISHSPLAAGPQPRTIRVLAVDESPLSLNLIFQALGWVSDIEVVGWAANRLSAFQKLLATRPDVVTLAIEMPGTEGIAFLKQLRANSPMPIVALSPATAGSPAAVDALCAGAAEVIKKPADDRAFLDFRAALPHKIRAAFASRRQSPVQTPPRGPAPRLVSTCAPSVIAIGCSTGGTQALERILQRMPRSCPGLVIAQHLPAKFSSTLVQRLKAVCRIDVKEAESGDLVRPGLALIAPGDRHLAVRRCPTGIQAIVNQDPRVCFQRPSVDVLFRSMARTAPRNSLGVILTGMGSDGAAGLLEMKRAGARTIAQDEDSCAIFGMPREAIRAGGVDQVLSLDDIASFLANLRSAMV